MAYSTIDDIRALLPEDELMALSDDEGLGEPSLSRVEVAIEQADAEIDAHCAVRYSVPVTPTPLALKRLSVDMAVYHLYSRAVVNVPAVREMRYKNAVRHLEGISKGLISLGLNEAAEAATDSGAMSNKAEGSNMFSREKLEGF